MPKPYVFRARVARLGRLKTHLWAGVGRLWKVMLERVVLALGLATKTQKTWFLRIGWATKSTPDWGENGEHFGIFLGKVTDWD